MELQEELLLTCTHLSRLVAAESLDIQVTEGVFQLQSNTGSSLENHLRFQHEQADEATEKKQEVKRARTASGTRKTEEKIDEKRKVVKRTRERTRERETRGRQKGL